ncbi:MAG TPA: 2-amino-4-hydroxy-6-hydroxymethyldihydropteridine diphosphokinase [Burkholderiaceae bacterium]|nr:2-amino-4-hydroxy-6-hydroxymethyldihydropteridine diphosphokinase [Burkholderiaceae bacterium]
MSSQSERAYIGLGANLGDARATVQEAVQAIAALPGTHLVARSQDWRSAPVHAEGPDFVNAVVAVDTTLTPRDLLAALWVIEQAHGRLRPYPNAPRTLDLDLLLHGRQVLDTPDLTLPHPRMHERAFVLRPLAQVAPAATIPGRGAVTGLLAAVAGQQVEPMADSPSALFRNPP